MIVRTIEMLLEYMATILCLYKISRKKFQIDIYIPLLFLIDFTVLLLIDKGVMTSIYKLIVYVCILIYTRSKIENTWKAAIKDYVLVMLSMMVLQYMIYFILSALRVPLGKMKIRGIIINCLICCFLVVWKESYFKLICKKLKELGRGGIILVLAISCYRLLFICNRYGIVSAETIIQFCVEILALSLALALWISSERENRQKARELQMYMMYNQAFEDTIDTIRIRQHEFKNHINAIKCMKYTISNQEELLLAQEQYCDDVLKDSKIGSLLKLKMEPVLIGFLYAKITTAEEAGIYIEYEVNPIDIRGKIEVYEIIELIGVLFDNAIEALREKENRKLILKLVNTDGGFVIEIANISRVYLNNEIESFCTYGYSTKGENRGIGLVRVKEIAKKANATLSIQNQVYEYENYLCFKIQFDNLDNRKR